MDYKERTNKLESLLKSAVKILAENNALIFANVTNLARINISVTAEPSIDRLSITIRIGHDPVELTFYDCNLFLEDKGFIVDDISVSKQQIKVWYHRNLEEK